jgi:hypothetical protein
MQGTIAPATQTRRPGTHGMRAYLR